MIRYFTRFIIKRPQSAGLVLSQSRFQVNGINEFSLVKKNCLNHCSSTVRNAGTSLVTKVQLPDISKLPHINAIIQTADEFEITEDEVKILMKHQPDLMSTSASSWLSLLEALSDRGFLKDDMLKILVKFPQVLAIKKHDIVSNIEVWFNAKLGRTLYIEVLTTHPRFLQINANYLARRINKLQQCFESKKRVGKLLLLAPNLLEEKENVLLDKLNYLNNLCIDPSEIASSGVLAHTSLHIKARHEFLIRSGSYKVPQKNFIKKLSKNPNVEMIVNTSNVEFAIKVAKLTKFEYDVFLEMFEQELAETALDDDL